MTRRGTSERGAGSYIAILAGGLAIVAAIIMLAVFFGRYTAHLVAPPTPVEKGK